MSLRFKTDDQFWFSFYHEAAHILLHSKKAIYVDDDKSTAADRFEANGIEASEIEADEFAANFLIHQNEYRRFVAEDRFTKAKIRAFAQEQDIAPGIVVGRLQHDEHIAYSHHNDLKRKLEWSLDS